MQKLGANWRAVLEPAGLVEILQRAVQVAFVAARNAPVVEGGGIVRLEPDGLGVILQRAATSEATSDATDAKRPLSRGRSVGFG